MATGLARPALLEGDVMASETRSSDDAMRGVTPAARGEDTSGKHQGPLQRVHRSLKDDGDFVTEWDPRLG